MPCGMPAKYNLSNQNDLQLVTKFTHARPIVRIPDRWPFAECFSALEKKQPSLTLGLSTLELFIN